MFRPILSMIALMAMSATALAQFGSPQQGGTNTGPFGPSPQQAPYGGQQPYPPHPRQPYPVQPQMQVPLIGVWSTTLYDTQGRVTASIFVQFGPDGRFQRRMIVRGGQTDVFGVWQYDPQNAILRTQSQDYEPKMNCAGGTCMQIPPSEPMGQIFTLQLQWVSANHFVTQDASGPIRWVRQQ